jgi:hypothetical protein
MPAAASARGVRHGGHEGVGELAGEEGVLCDARAVDPVERYGPAVAARVEVEHRAAVRRRAIRRIPFVAAIPVVAVTAVLLGQGWAQSRGWRFGRGLGLALGFTGVPLLSAVAEIVIGIEVQRLGAPVGRAFGLATWRHRHRRRRARAGTVRRDRADRRRASRTVTSRHAQPVEDLLGGMRVPKHRHRHLPSAPR